MKHALIWSDPVNCCESVWLFLPLSLHSSSFKYASRHSADSRLSGQVTLGSTVAFRPMHSGVSTEDRDVLTNAHLRLRHAGRDAL